MTDDTCLFCRVLSGELEASLIAENGHAVAFLDHSPRSPGHALVVPRVHAPTILALPEEEVGPFFAFVREVAALLGGKLGTDAMTIGINQGPIAGQTIPHLHVHLIPRYDGDGGRSIHDIVHTTPTPAQQDILNSLTP